MIPLKDSVRSRMFPAVNIIFIALNALVFFYELSLGDQLKELFDSYALIPARFFQLADSPNPPLAAMVVPFFSSMFLHGGWMHFIGNMWFLWIFGDNVEDSMGHARYAVFYLFGGLGAGIIHLMLNADSNLHTIGASGAISAVMGAYLVLYPRGRVLTLIPIFFFFQILEIPALFFLLIWIGFQTLQAMATIGMSADIGGVAVWAHIGGFLIGAFTIFLFRKRERSYDYEDRFYRRR